MKDKSRTLPPSHTHTQTLCLARSPRESGALCPLELGARDDRSPSPRPEAGSAEEGCCRSFAGSTSLERTRRTFTGESCWWLHVLLQTFPKIPAGPFFFFSRLPLAGISDLWIFYSVYDFLSCSQDRGERLSLEQQHYQYNATGWQAQVWLEGCRSRAHRERRECRGREPTRGGVTPGPGAPVDRARAASRSLKATSEPKTNFLEKPAQERLV